MSSYVGADKAHTRQSKNTLPRPDSQVVRAFSEKSAELSKEINARNEQPKEIHRKGEIEIHEHNMSVQELEKEFEVDVAGGLSQRDVERRLLKYGRNELQPPPSKPWWVLFIEQMTGFFSLLLLAAGVLCFVAYALSQDDPSNLYLGIVLVTVVLLTGIFSYFQEAKSQAVMEGFKNFLPDYCSVIRDGVQQEILAAEVVPGDIVVVKSGEKIPADFRVCEFSQFKVDNASLTGESLPQKRFIDNKEENPLEATNLAFYGTLCVEGSATGIVIRTGDKTVIGTIANLAATTDNVETPIALEIEHFIHIISTVAIILGVSFLLIGVGKGTDIVDNVVFCIGIIVANVPEGLLATVTVSLTLTAKRMAAKQVLVKNLEAVETLGSTTVIASDKTGTLTCNRMTVAHLWYDRKIHVAAGESNDAVDVANTTFKLLHTIAAVCNKAVFKADEKNMSLPILARDCKGDASESALIKFCEPIRNVLEHRSAHKQVCIVPFNSANKFMATVHCQDNDWNKPRLVLMKGAPERIWARCDTVLVNGERVPKEEVEESYLQAQSALMDRGERVLGFCMKELPADEYPQGFAYDPDELNFPIEAGLTFVGLISLIDPPRPRVPPAVLNCLNAGIKVVMVTGDHPDTAEAIAKQVHIIRSPTRRDIANREGVHIDEIRKDDPRIKARVVTGTELKTLDDDALDHILDYDQLVFARTSPAQKLIIVKGLQSKKFVRIPGDLPKPCRHVVAVTGDGVNDSPALKAADIGVAMGIVGSDVAKDAADMILLNDNFASIVDGVEEGRLIFDNLKKSIAYTLSSNIPEISPFLVNIVSGIPLPLPTVLILCIDLGTDMVPAISLAYENKESNIMQKPPRDMLSERLVTAKLISFSYLQIGVVQALAGFYTYFVVLNDYGFRPSSLPGNEDFFFKDERDNLKFFGGANYDEPDDPRRHGADLGVGRRLELNGATLDMHPCNIERPGVCHVPFEALSHAQCALFISIIVVQWADLIACKTRTLSLKHQGMRNTVLNFGLLFETVLGAALCYIKPLNGALLTRDIQFVHWLPAMPFSMLILIYDETRKYFMRTWGKGNWLERNTYY